MGKRARLVHSYASLPPFLPIWQTAVLWLVLDRLQPARWLEVAGWVFMVLWWCSVVLGWLTQRQVNLFQLTAEEAKYMAGERRRAHAKPE